MSLALAGDRAQAIATGENAVAICERIEDPGGEEMRETLAAWKAQR